MYHSTDKQMLNSNEHHRLYKTAVKALKQANIKPSKQIKYELHQQVQSLQSRRKQLYEEHKECKKVQKQDRIIEQNLIQLLKLVKTVDVEKER
ncbi:hypothetical protein D5006_14605, partial [Listeria monocytogenes]|nr:hypothetical protein [Listeria monocytogenes]